MNSDADGKSNKNRWRSIADREVESHRTVINVAHFRQHSVKVNAVDGGPSECREPRIVQTDRDELAGELRSNQSLIKFHKLIS